MIPSGQPLVSVLMTVYNREKYIREAIESVLASSYQHFELILADDGSVDKSIEIASSYSKKDERIKLLLGERNLGDYPNRNRAAFHAKGKYLKYVDADDYIYPWGLECLVQMMENFPAAGWGLCSLEQDDNRPFPFMLTPEETFRYNYFGPGLFHKAPLSSIIKKELFDQVNGFSGKQYLGDFEMWHLLALKSNVVLMPHGMVWHRLHDEQQSTDYRVDERIPFKYSVAAHHFFKNYSAIPLDSHERNQIERKLHKTMMRQITRNRVYGRWKLARELKNMMQSSEYDFKLPG